MQVNPQIIEGLMGVYRQNFAEADTKMSKTTKEG